MEIDESDFRSLYSLLMGQEPAAELGEAPESGAHAAILARTPSRLRLPGPWDVPTLATAVSMFGVLGWDKCGLAGSFLQDSPEALEALQALANYQRALEYAELDPETRAAARAGCDRRSQAFWALLPDGGPLDRLGWDDEGLPPLDKIAAGTLKPARPNSVAKEMRNDQKLIGALASALLGQNGFSSYPSAPKLEALVQDIEVWAKDQGIKGLGEDTVRPKLKAALAVLAGQNPPDGTRK